MAINTRQPNEDDSDALPACSPQASGGTVRSHPFLRQGIRLKVEATPPLLSTLEPRCCSRSRGTNRGASCPAGTALASCQSHVLVDCRSCSASLTVLRR